MSIFKQITLDLAKNIVLDDKNNLLNEINMDVDLSSCRWTIEKALTVLPQEIKDEYFIKYKLAYKKKAIEAFGFIYCNFMEGFEMRLKDNFCIVYKDEIEKIIIQEIDQIIFEKIQEIELTNNI